MASEQYVIRAGDTLSKLAVRFGLSDFRHIYFHNENQEFRRQRPNPDLIYPGDRVSIPSRDIALTEEQKNSFKSSSLTTGASLLSSKKNEIASKIGQIREIESFGIFYFDGNGNSEDLKRVPKRIERSIDDQDNFENWIIIESIPNKEVDIFNMERVHQVLSWRGWSCVGAGLAIAGGVAAAPMSGGLSFLAAIGAVTGSAQCGLFVGRSINSMAGQENWNEFMDRSPTYRIADNVLDAGSLAGSAAGVASGVKTITRIPSLFGAATLEAKAMTMVAKESPLLLMKDLINNDSFVFSQVVNIIGGSLGLSTSASSGVIDETYNVYVTTKKVKQ